MAALIGPCADLGGRDLPLAAAFVLQLLLWLAVLAFDVLSTMRGLLPGVTSVGLAAVVPPICIGS